MFRRALAAALVLLLAFAGWKWLPAETEPSRSVPVLTSTGECYAVDVTSDTTMINIPGEFSGPCDLIVSSLADAEETFYVRVSSRQHPSANPNPLRQIPRTPQARRRPDHRNGIERLEPFESTADAALRPRNGAVSNRTFDLHVTDEPLEAPHGYIRILAKCVSEGDSVRIYSDTQAPPDGLADGLIDEIVRLLDQRIIPRSCNFLGTHTDIDGDGKLAVLLTPWLGKLQGGKTSVNGFVRSSDFSTDGTSPFSNRADVLYLNSGLKPGPELAALLAHEYTHAVCCSIRRHDLNRPRGMADEADWLNEAIAHVAEQLHDAGWSNLDRRVQRFLETPEQTPLVVRDYYRSGLWRDPACRGATYLFLQWCVDTFGVNVLRDLARSPLTGIDNIEAVTGHRFDGLIRNWTIAVNDSTLESVSLQGTLGSCRLAGPNRHECLRGDAPVELKLRGTATAFVRCLPDERSGRTCCLVVQAPRAAKLLVTIVRSNDPVLAETEP